MQQTGVRRKLYRWSKWLYTVSGVGECVIGDDRVALHFNMLAHEGGHRLPVTGFRFPVLISNFQFLIPISAQSGKPVLGSPGVIFSAFL